MSPEPSNLVIDIVGRFYSVGLTLLFGLLSVILITIYNKSKHGNSIKTQAYTNMWFMAWGGAVTAQALVVLTTIIIDPTINLKGIRLLLVHVILFLGLMTMMTNLFKLRNIVLNPYLELTEALVIASEGDLEVYLSHQPKYEALRAFNAYNLLITRTSKTIYKVSLLLKNYQDMLNEFKPTIIESQEYLSSIQNKLHESLSISTEITQKLGEIRSLIENIKLENEEFFEKLTLQIEELATLTDNNTIVALNAQIEASHSTSETSETFELIAGSLQEMAKQTYRLVNEIQEELKNMKLNLEDLETADESIKNYLEIASRIPNIFQQLVETINEMAEQLNKTKHFLNKFQDISQIAQQILQEYKEAA